jgi:hypothetical protein
MKLRDVYNNVQQEMITVLRMNRSVVAHKGEMGTASESDWIEWFKKYLPKRYQVSKAFVVDSKDQISEQIDVVIYDTQYSHLVFNHQNIFYIPSESVYAVFEVKQELNKGNLDYAANKAMSVRKLHRTSVAIQHAGGIYQPKEPHFIPAGILTVTSEWKEPFGKTFKKNLLSFSEDKSLQLGCVVQGGAFSVPANLVDGEIEISNKEKSLVSFFFNLLLRLQSLGTVTAIDIKAYAELLG